MAEMIGIYMTQQGYELLAKKQLSIEDTQFTRMAVGSGDIRGIIPRDMTALVNEAYDFSIESKDIINKTTVMVTGTLRNKEVVLLEGEGEGQELDREVAKGFFVTQTGLFANDPDKGEILYSVMLFENPDYMPAYNGKGISHVTYTFYTDVADAENVTLKVNSHAYVGIEEFKRFKECSLARSKDFEKHIKDQVFSEKGVHGIRFWKGLLQVWDGEKWIYISSEGGADTGKFHITDGVLWNTHPYGKVTPNEGANTLEMAEGLGCEEDEIINLIQ